MHSRAISTDIWRRTHRVDAKLTGNGGKKIQLQEGREARLPPSDLGSRCDGDQTCKRLPGKLALYLWLWQHSWNWSTYSSTSRRSTPNRCSWKKNGRTTPTGPTKMAGLTSGTWGTAHRYLWWGKQRTRRSDGKPAIRQQQLPVVHVASHALQRPRNFNADVAAIPEKSQLHFGIWVPGDTCYNHQIETWHSHLRAQKPNLC